MRKLGLVLAVVSGVASGQPAPPLPAAVPESSVVRPLAGQHGGAAAAQQQSNPIESAPAALGAAGGSTKGKPSNPQAASLVYQAGVAMQRKNLDEAASFLDQARALNADEVRLWVSYGFLHLQRNDKAAALGDFEKEIALHPDFNEAYAPLFDLQMNMDKRADAEQTLRAWVKMDARSPQAAARLVSMLVNDDKAAEAVTIGKDAAARLAGLAKSDSRMDAAAVARAGEGLQFELSKAEKAAGMKDEALKTLVEVLKGSSDSAILNNGAFALADANVELPLAEKSARSAVTRVELASQQISLSMPVQSLKQADDGVAAVWDTLGWVLFREGKLDDAQTYVRAAWMQRQSLAVADHLGQIATAKGDKTLALTVYETALAEAAGVKADDADLVRVKAAADQLRKGGAVAAKDGLRSMLTFAVGPPKNGISGAGDFMVELGFGIVGNAEPVSKTNTPGLMLKVLGSKVAVWPPNSGAKLVMKGTMRCKGGACVLGLKNL